MGTQTYINGKIFTSNPNNDFATAMVVESGNVTWIGDQEEIAPTLEHPIDLQGKTVLPGFIDAHLHPLFLADARKQIPCTSPTISSIAELVEKVKEQRDTQQAGEWIESWGYDEGKLAEGRAPTRLDLDLATTDAPVIVTRTCAHIIAVNSKALEMAGIDQHTPDPVGGEIDRDEHGEPTGILRESAKDLVKDLQPTLHIEDLAELIVELSDHLSSHGITGIAEMMGDHEPVDYFNMYQRAAEKGLKQRIGINYQWEEFQKLNAANLVTDVSADVFINGIKLFADGSVSGRTAWVNPGYLGEPDNYGISTTTEAELQAAADAAEKHQIQLVIHAMGEEAINQVIDTFYERKGWLSNGPSIRIEHASFPTFEAMKRSEEAGIAFVPQPVFLFAEIESYLHNVGKDRTEQSYPVKTMLEQGVQVAFSSDAPATSWADPVNPFVGLKSAVARIAYDGTDTGQDERIDIETAVALYTREAQKVSRTPNVGQLTTGYKADFIVLNEDIFTIDPKDIDQVTVAKTYIGGVKVYEQEEE